MHPLLEVAGDDDVRRRFLELRDPETGEERQSVVRDELVEMFVPMAQRVARRFRNRNEPVDDLGQVALLGLLKAVDGFDPERSVSFSSYAIPTMLGEIKRHFRDKGWSLHVPRRLKELSLNAVSATGDLTQQLGRHLLARGAARAPPADVAPAVGPVDDGRHDALTQGGPGRPIPEDCRTAR